MPTMIALPWRWTKAARPATTLVFASRFDAKGFKARLSLLTAGVQMRRAVLASPGCLGASLRAHPISGRYYTLSMWQDEASLSAFSRGRDHRRVVGAITQLGPVNAILISREGDGSRPGWADTVRWVDAAEPGPYLRNRAPAQDSAG